VREVISARQTAEGFLIPKELFDAICESICPPNEIVDSPVTETRFPPNVRARALRVCRLMADERIDAAIYGA